MKKLALALALIFCPAVAIAQGGPANCSGTIAQGGTAQIAVAANNNRLSILIQNPADATEKLAVNWPTTASLTSDSIEITAGGQLYLSGNDAPTTAIYVNATTTGHRFICKTGQRP